MSKTTRRTLNPDVWGRHAWNFLFQVAHTYPQKPTEEDRQVFKNFFMALKDVLPCDKCRNHFTENCETIEIDKHLKTPEELFNWVLKIRNAVLKSQDRPIMSRKEAMTCYITKPFLPFKVKVLLGLSVALVVIVGVYYLKNKKLL